MEAGGVLSKANPLDVANLLKQFFRELPNPLLTSALYWNFVQGVSLTDCHSRSSAILNLCLLLPARHLATLRHTMCFLARVASISELNKMDVSNISICLAPNLLRGPPKKVKWWSSSHCDVTETCLLEAEIAVARILILEAQSIGIIPEELLERHRRDAQKFCLISNGPLEKSLMEFGLDETTMKQGKPSSHGCYSFCHFDLSFISMLAVDPVLGWLSLKLKGLSGLLKSRGRPKFGFGFGTESWKIASFSMVSVTAETDLDFRSSTEGLFYL